MADDGFEEPRPLNPRAVAGLAVSVLVAVVALFLLQPLRASGWSFQQAFWTLVIVEFVAAIGVAVSTLRLRRG